MGVYTVHLVGESKYQPAVKRTREGEIVLLQHEPDNAFDDRAVRALNLFDETIGYVERDHWLQRMIAVEGRPASARVQEIIGGTRGKAMRGVVLEVRTGADVEGAKPAGRSPRKSNAGRDKDTMPGPQSPAPPRPVDPDAERAWRKGMWWMLAAVIVLALISRL